MTRTILPTYFGTIEPELRVERYELRAQCGLCISVLDYGARIAAVTLPKEFGAPGNVVLAYPSAAAYRDDRWYLGATIGRYANRIANGEFELDGVRYALSTNERGTTLHGGIRGFDRAVWRKVHSREVDGIAELILQHVSPDGDQGFPGELEVNVRFVVGPDAHFEIHYLARTSAPTVVNLTNHSYFNLSGNERRPISTHRLRVNAEYYTPVDDRLIPNGGLGAVAGTRFDLRDGPFLGEFDTNFVIDRRGPGLALAATLSDPESGRAMDLFTTQPGLQVFSGRRDAVALEPQHFPDSPHYRHFPSTVVRPSHPMTAVGAYYFRLDGVR